MIMKKEKGVWLLGHTGSCKRTAFKRCTNTERR